MLLRPRITKGGPGSPPRDGGRHPLPPSRAAAAPGADGNWGDLTPKRGFSGPRGGFAPPPKGYLPAPGGFQARTRMRDCGSALRACALGAGAQNGGGGAAGKAAPLPGRTKWRRRGGSPVTGPRYIGGGGEHRHGRSTPGSAPAPKKPAIFP